MDTLYRLLTLPLAMWLSATGATATAQWPSFRGSNATGVATAADPPVSWDMASGTNVAWRTPIPGLSHSSPIVWDDRVYLTASVALAETDAELRLGDVDAAGIDSAGDMVRHSWRLYAVDLASGDIVWHTVAHEGLPRMRRHVKGSHASATPATDGRTIVALFGSEGLFAFDMEGRVLWQRDLGIMDVGLVDDPTYQWGPASSPIIYEDLVIVQNDRHRDSFVAAFDIATGREVWRADRDEMPSWATPTIVRGAHRDVLVTNSPRFLRGYDPRTGVELWRLPDGDTQVKTPTPVGGDGVVVVTGGYPPRGRPIYAIRQGGSGTLAAEAGPDGPLWRVERGSPYTATPLIHAGIVYVVTDNGILSAYEADTGERIYQQRLGRGGSFSASPVYASGRLYVTSEDGLVFVIRSGREFEVLATNEMNEVCMATPAPVGGMLVVRTRSHLIALGAGS